MDRNSAEVARGETWQGKEHKCVPPWIIWGRVSPEDIQDV